MCVSIKSVFLQKVFLVLNLYFLLLLTSEIKENAFIVIADHSDDTNNYEQETPLDLSLKNNSNPQRSITNSKKSTNINDQSESLMPDFFINSTFFDTNEYKNCKNTFEITYRHLKFFFTKRNIYDIAVAEIDENVDKSHFIFLKQILIETKYLILNIKNDIIETMEAINPSSQMTIYNADHLKSINAIEIHQDYWINMIKTSPIHIKLDFKTSSNLDEFLHISYSFYGSSSCISTNRLSRYINSNYKLFSLKGLLDTLIVVSFESRQMQSDLKSIIFCVLFFYKHAENNRIITMEFILKDIMIRTILLVKLLKLNEDDDLKSEHKKQELSQ
ncbi:hypothetical protein NBO_455g0001 [Nosema bombycis CQ1]|uniref:Uncharacterized protein n=1 Tax=Nosema bombycis (strain CQ1 / CVCC 102059) TaxID=578461 RepID=R0KQ99_NOSB1|nr:hypothetical protein NBO_455g0001 [Nosema bombycis CQ1]|eukprot:EOB12372.1 hypothetical protein NBO_455g0001 [Nosema bombycis CQ1]